MTKAWNNLTYVAGASAAGYTCCKIRPRVNTCHRNIDEMVKYWWRIKTNQLI